MMTPKQIEAAARELCRLRKLDPDAMIGHSAHTWPDTTWTHSPAWVLAVREILAHEKLEAAMQVGRSTDRRA